MDVIVLNGPMGVGKTTIGMRIADRYPGTAFIDGDWCMDLHPFVGNEETKSMAVDNILHMIGNYRKCSKCRMVVLSWLMDDEWVCDRLSEGIRQLGLNIKSFTLICDETNLKKRWHEDKECPWRTEEWFQAGRKSVAYFSGKDNCIDTSDLSQEAVVDLIMEKVK